MADPPPLTGDLVRDNLLRELADKTKTQHDISWLYAEAICHVPLDSPDWGIMNRAIMARWSKGLVRVKEKAWKMLELR